MRRTNAKSYLSMNNHSIDIKSFTKRVGPQNFTQPCPHPEKSIFIKNSEISIRKVRNENGQKISKTAKKSLRLSVN